MTDYTIAGRWVYVKDEDVRAPFHGWSRSPQAVIDIVCDGDYWAKMSANGATLRGEQYAVPVERAVLPDYE